MSNPEKTYIGLDPGASGGVAFINGDRVDLLAIEDESPQRISEALRDTVLSGPCVAVIEEVASRPKQGLSATFSFGRNYGLLLGMLIAHGVPFQTVRPQQWQGDIFIPLDKVYKPLPSYPKEEPSQSEATSKSEEPSQSPATETPKRKRKLELDTKRTSINASRRLFPHVSLLRNARCKTPHDGLSDALLMAEYARRHNL